LPFVALGVALGFLYLKVPIKVKDGVKNVGETFLHYFNYLLGQGLPSVGLLLHVQYQFLHLSFSLHVQSA